MTPSRHSDGAARRQGEQRAVVIGGSIAGLLAARVLADHYREVVLLERDELPTSPALRKGTPHAGHTHGLLARGLQTIEALLPGFTQAMERRGGQLGDVTSGVPFVAGGRRFVRDHSGIQALTASRLAIEDEIRLRVRSLANVSVRCGVDAAALISDDERRRVLGVRVRPLQATAEPADETLSADLVVDASGRGSRCPQWLQAMGYAAPTQEEVDVDIAYVTGYFYRGPTDLPQQIRGVVCSATPELSRPGVVLAQEPDEQGRPRWVASVGGYRGDHPPPTLDGLRGRAKDIGCEELIRITHHAELLGALTSYRFAKSQRRRYERLRRFPQGLLVIGDAIASFNPVYGQGMTVAACEVELLRRFLQTPAHHRSSSNWALRFFRAAARLVDVPWQIAVGADLALPCVPGERPLAVRWINRYMARVFRAAECDGAVATRFVQVAHMLKPPTALMTPAMIWRVWRAQTKAAPDGAARGTLGQAA